MNDRDYNIFQLAKIVLSQTTKFTPNDIYKQLKIKNIDLNIDEIKTILISYRNNRIIRQIDLSEVYVLL